MPGTPVSEVIVLLPGITGSVLQKDGKDVWALSGSADVKALTSLGASIKQLALHGGTYRVTVRGDRSGDVNPVTDVFVAIEEGTDVEA